MITGLRKYLLAGFVVGEVLGILSGIFVVSTARSVMSDGSSELLGVLVWSLVVAMSVYAFEKLGRRFESDD